LFAVLVGVHKYSAVWHLDSATECVSVGDQRYDGSLGVREPSTEIHEPQQYLPDSVLHQFAAHWWCFLTSYFFHF